MTEITDTEYLNARLEACAANLKDYRDSWTAARDENRQLHQALEQIAKLAYTGGQDPNHTRHQILEILEPLRGTTINETPWKNDDD